MALFDYFAANLRQYWFDFVASAALLLALLGGLAALYVWWRRRYTRERYAFVALSATVGLTLTAVSVLTMPHWLEIVLFLLRQLGLTIEAPRDLNLAERILVVLAIGFAIREINKNHQLWDGPKSAAHRQRERLREDLGLVQEGIQEVRRMLRREPAPAPVEDVAPQQTAYQLQLPTESLSWPEQVYDLLRLSRPSYHFDAANGWHELERCWTGHNIKTNEEIGVLSMVDAPTTAELERFVTYCKDNTGYPDRLILFAALPGTDTQHTEELAQFGVDLLTEDDLVTSLIDFSSYRRHIRDRFARDHLPDSTLTLNDVYVSATATQGISSEEGANSVTIDDQLFDWSVEESQRHLALLGDYGQGKSTCALAFTHRLLTDENPSGRVPLLIELRGTSPSTLQPLEFLGAWSARFGFNPQALLKLIIAGKTILIFEGFDEMAYISDFESRVQHLQALWRFCYPRAKLLFTGRRNFFLDDQETLQSLGIRGASGGPFCEPLHLRPFASEQIRSTLEQSNFPATDELLSLAEQSASFREVVTRPSTLYMISVLWATEANTLRAGVTSAKVMQLFINSTYMRQSEKHRHRQLGDSFRFMLLTVAERAYFMFGIAAHMATQRLKNQITRDDLEVLTERLYEEMPDQELAKKARAEIDEPAAPLKARIRDRPDALDAIKTDVRTYGLLVRDPSRQDAFRFPHKSYLEVLFAGFANSELRREEIWYANSIKAATGAKLSDLSTMPESVNFLGDILSEELPASSDEERAFLVKVFTDLIGIREGTSEEARTVTAMKLFEALVVSKSKYKFAYKILAALNRVLVFRLSSRFTLYMAEGHHSKFVLILSGFVGFVVYPICVEYTGPLTLADVKQLLGGVSGDALEKMLIQGFPGFAIYVFIALMFARAWAASPGFDLWKELMVRLDYFRRSQS